MVGFLASVYPSAGDNAGVDGVADSAGRTAWLVDGVQIPSGAPDGVPPLTATTWTATGTYYRPGEWPAMLAGLFAARTAARHSDVVSLMQGVSDAAAARHVRRHPSRLTLPPFPGHGAAVFHAEDTMIRWALLGPAAVLWRPAAESAAATCRFPAGVTRRRLPGGWVYVSDDRWRQHAQLELAHYCDVLSRSGDPSDAHQRFVAALQRRRCVDGGFWLPGSPRPIPATSIIRGDTPATDVVLGASHALALRLADYAHLGADANPMVGFVDLDGFVDAFRSDPARVLHSIRHDMETPFAAGAQPDVTSAMLNTDGPFAAVLSPHRRFR